jgi:hypothetical protein
VANAANPCPAEWTGKKGLPGRPQWKQVCVKANGSQFCPVKEKGGIPGNNNPWLVSTVIFIKDY